MIKFLGSSRCALILIAIACALVIAATAIESHTGSHKLAEKWIYKSPFFLLLLCGFFLNILISALTRWPFKLRHIPFLMTHLGLLMVIAGVFIKQLFGVQGHLLLIEGEEKNLLTLPDTLALEIIKKGREPRQYSIDRSLPLPITSKTVSPHGQEIFSAWCEGDCIILKGFEKMSLPIDKMATINGKSVRLTAERAELSDNHLYGGQNFLHFQVKEEGALVTYGNGLGLYESQEIAANTPPLSYAVYDGGFKGYTALLTFSVPDVKDEEAFREELKVLAWSRKILQENEFASQLLHNCPDELKEQTLISELYSLKEMLPELPHQEELIPYYLQLQNIEWKTPLEPFEIESPIQRKVDILPPSKKPEDNKPCLALKYKDASTQILLLNSPFKTLSPSGRELLHLTEERLQLPFSVRLHQARDIKYPGTDATCSYECDLSITHPENSLKVTISMNNVYESPEGFRIYLSGMALADPSGVRSVQLVVNRDPAKYWLTYPGGFLISMGIAGLFLPLKRLLKII